MGAHLFSNQADAYAKYRPSYPIELINYILSFTNSRQCAWDVATGNGQAALLLANYFENVFATDASEKQLSFAVRRHNITYSVAPAEKTSFANNSFDLITIAQAYHWFNAELFAKEALRVARPGAVIAAWGYTIPRCGIEPLDTAIHYFYKQVVGRYWDPERKHIDDAYRTVFFPFSPLPVQSFSIETKWTVDDLAGYFQSWSSVQHFITAHASNPVDAFFPDLKKAWPVQMQHAVFSFPLFLRMGRIIK
jgi:ubiquinone/menaquinone biosynthesis C-methylase UbiE